MCPFSDVDCSDENRSKTCKVPKYKEPKDSNQPCHGSITKRLRDEATSDDEISILLNISL
ncbi:hypothetical protein HDU77_000543, partial [Chytriomyces hyalinus]